MYERSDKDIKPLTLGKHDLESLASAVRLVKHLIYFRVTRNTEKA